MQKNSELPQDEFPYNLVKLITGEELISRKIGDTKKYLILENPYVIIKDYSGDVSKIFLFKWMSFSENRVFNLDKNHIMAYNDANDKIIEYYEYSTTQEIIDDEMPDNEYSNGTIH